MGFIGSMRWCEAKVRRDVGTYTTDYQTIETYRDMSTFSQYNVMELAMVVCWVCQVQTRGTQIASSLLLAPHLTNCAVASLTPGWAPVGRSRGPLEAERAMRKCDFPIPRPAAPARNLVLHACRAGQQLSPQCGRRRSTRLSGSNLSCIPKTTTSS